MVTNQPDSVVSFCWLDVVGRGWLGMLVDDEVGEGGVGEDGVGEDGGGENEGGVLERRLGTK